MVFNFPTSFTTVNRGEIGTNFDNLVYNFFVIPPRKLNLSQHTARYLSFQIQLRKKIMSLDPSPNDLNLLVTQKKRFARHLLRIKIFDFFVSTMETHSHLPQ